MLVSDPLNVEFTKPLYGNDDRVEVIDADIDLCLSGLSVAALFPAHVLSAASDNRWELELGPSLENSNWCSSERFAAQPHGAHCTGFLIADDTLVTAAHCINAADDAAGDGLNCNSVAIVFDYKLRFDGIVPRNFMPHQVYQCEEILAGQQSPIGADWRVIRLDRSTGRSALELYKGDVESDLTQELHVLGHPLGLPMKVAGNGRIVEASERPYFFTNLDAYKGNSGSPVLIQRERKPMVVGLLSGGEIDYRKISTAGNCKQSRKCRGDGCRGERVTAARVFAQWGRKHLDPDTKAPTDKVQHLSSFDSTVNPSSLSCN